MNQTQDNKPIVIAHRGYSAKYPENTMIAFEKALEVGADMIELDICLSKDGKFVVIHDDTLDRTTKGKGLVKEKTWDELKDLDAGSWFDPQYSQERLPLLEKVLKTFGKQIDINIEIKEDIADQSTQNEMIEKLVKLITEHGDISRVLISSFETSYLKVLVNKYPSLKIGYLFHQNGTNEIFDKNRELLKKCFSFHPEIGSCTNKPIWGTKLPSHLKIYPWFLNADSIEHYRTAFLDEKIHGLFVNDPRTCIAEWRDLFDTQTRMEYCEFRVTARHISELESLLIRNEREAFIIRAAGFAEMLMRRAYKMAYLYRTYDERIELIESEKRKNSNKGIEACSLVILSSLMSSHKITAQLSDVKNSPVSTHVDWNTFAEHRNSVVHLKKEFADSEPILKLCNDVFTWIKEVTLCLGDLDRVIIKNGVTLDNVHSLYSIIRNHLMRTSQFEQTLTIKNLALDMMTTFYQLESMIRDKRIRDVDYKGLLIDGSSPTIRDICKIGVSPDGALHVCSSLKKLLADNRHQLADRNVTISIKQYGHLPVIHGFIIDTTDIYWSITNICEHGITGGGDLYNAETIDLNDHAKTLGHNFVSWFEHYWAVSKEI